MWKLPETFTPPWLGSRGRLLAVGLALAAVAATLGVASQGGWYEVIPATPDAAAPDAATLRRLAALRPGGPYLVIDSHSNGLHLHHADGTVRDMVCSTGSGVELRDPRTGRSWIFDTPRGERRVERKTRNPVWIKPDWAFAEEGVEPPEGLSHRVDDRSLGDYGLYLGDGYIIHGTLFQTLLGRSLTHGCVRLGDEDLEYVYQKVPLGTRVFLY
jgi:L,D-transpeptidase YbiS